VAAYLLSLRDDVVMDEPAAGELRLQVPGRPMVSLRFKQITPPFRELFLRLRDGGAAEDSFTPQVMEAEGPQGLFKLTHFLKKMEEARVVCRGVEMNGALAARLVPLSDRFVFDADVPASVRLSRFALMRRDGDRMVIESPRGFARVEVHDARAASAVAALAAPAEGVQLAERIGCSEDQAGALIALLWNAGALTAGGADDVEEANPALRQWEFHDLYFHSRSRIGRHANPFGGVFPFEGKIDQLPAFKPPMSGTTIPLARPDLDRLSHDDVPFTQVVEARQSVREHADAPVSVEQLGEFLYRTVRVRHSVQTDHGEIAFRLYPSGGALYEMEIYLVVDRAAGLESGLYHYDAKGHALEHVADRTKAVGALLDAAYYTADQKCRPQVLIVLAARFQRMQWKYRSMVYAAILKHVGVVYQTMYLVATAMGLAPCGLGGGHSDLFADAAGLDYYEETSVGEFILGTKA
jgi:oxazoline/thiazoline dehydrogenase